MSQDDGYIELKDIEISFSGRTPRTAISFHLQVDDTAHDFQPEGSARNVTWNCGIYVSRRSQISLSVRKMNNGCCSFFANPVVANIALDTGRPEFKEDAVYSHSDTRIQVNFTFAESITRERFIELLGKDVRSALAEKVMLLDKVKKVSDFVDIVLDVGKDFAELNDTAKLVVGLVDRLFKVMREPQEFRDTAKDLAELLDVQFNQANIVPENLRSDSVRERLKDVMKVIEEILKFIESRMNNYSPGKWITRQSELAGLKKKLEQASQNLDSCFVVNIYTMTAEARRNDSDLLLKEKLRPVLSARSSNDHRCLEGTRKEPLDKIMNWAKAVRAPRELYHVHAIAGSGKSSMASTISERLEEEKMLAGAFFCKRDIPDQRDPYRILPSLSYTLALCNEAYRGCVMRSLKDEPDITSRTIEQQLKMLFREPLAELSCTKTLSNPFVFVVDALDECGDDVSRPKMADSLCQIASLTDWLKVFVTSRPTNELMRKFSSSHSQVVSVNLNDVDAGSDIELYTRDSLEKLVSDSGLNSIWLNEDTVEKLAKLASGLFIWTSTMLKFVRDQLDMGKAMQLILSGHAAAAETSLDNLYIKVIESCGSSDDNLRLIKAVLGTVFITSKNRPLSIDGLHDFLQGKGEDVSKNALVTVINRLRSVLYEDGSKGGAIRVCHPSFLDFIESRNRCGVYWTNVEQLHASMVETSLKLMKMKLKFNICDLKSSYIANKDISDLSQRIKDRIPESLIYACLYWTTHLTEANRMTIEPLVVGLLQSLDAIYWVEVLSLVEGVKIGLNALQTVMGFFKNNEVLCSSATDLRRLISSSYDAISHSTPHLYISALAWLPKNSPFRPMLSCMKSDALIATGRNKDWPSMLWISTLNGIIYQVAFSQDDKSIAACCRDGNISIFDAKTGVLEMKLQGHQYIVWSIAFSPDGKQLASGSADRSVIVWDLRTGDIVGKPLTGHSDTVASVVYSPDGRYIASRSGNGEIRIWGSQSGAVVRDMEGCRDYGRLAYSHDGTKIACCGEEGIVIRDAQSGDLPNKLSNIGHVASVAYSQDGRFLASGDMNCTVRIWDTKTLIKTAELNGHGGQVYSVIFSSDGSTLFSASNEGKMIRWDMSSRQMSGMAVQESNISSAACSSDGQLYAAASRDGSLRVWNSESHFQTESRSVNDRLWQVVCSPGGSEIASASSSGEICIHSLDSGSLLRTLRGHAEEVKAVAYSPDGKLLTSGSYDCTVRVWDATTGLELRKFEGHTSWVSAVIFLPDGRHVVSSSFDGTVRRWNIDNDTTDEAILHEQPSQIWCMCVSLNGGLLAFGDRNGCIRFGDLSGGETKELRIEPSSIVRSLSFSPDETYLASGSADTMIRLWHLETLTEVRTFEGHTNRILSVSFSQDGQQLLSSAEYTIRQWRVDTGEEIRQLNGHTNAVFHSVYSVDEKHIISCSEDGTIRIWNADAEENIFVPEIDQNLLSLELMDGWIKSRVGELLLWVPSEYRNGFKDMCERCIPADAPNHPVRLDWSKLVKGENWTDVFVSSEERGITPS